MRKNNVRRLIPRALRAEAGVEEVLVGASEGVIEHVRELYQSVAELEREVSREILETRGRNHGPRQLSLPF